MSNLKLVRDDDYQFSDEEIIVAKAVREEIFNGSVPEELKSIYMAGEIVAAQQLDYWKQKYEAMKQRCEAAEKLIPFPSAFQNNEHEKSYNQWQSLKQKQ